MTLSGKVPRYWIFFQECCIVDIWRSLNPNVMGFTWDKLDGSLSFRIDIIGCPYSWVPFVNSVFILPCPLSNHSSVVLDVSIPQSIPRGPGKWILNTSILNDSDYISSIKSFWATWHLPEALLFLPSRLVGQRKGDN